MGFFVGTGDEAKGAAVTGVTGVTESNVELELSEKKEEAKHEAKKRELLLEAEKKRSYKEGEPSTWLVEH